MEIFHVLRNSNYLPVSAPTACVVIQIVDSERASCAQWTVLENSPLSVRLKWEKQKALQRKGKAQAKHEEKTKTSSRRIGLRSLSRLELRPHARWNSVSHLSVASETSTRLPLPLGTSVTVLVVEPLDGPQTCHVHTDTGADL